MARPESGKDGLSKVKPPAAVKRMLWMQSGKAGLDRVQPPLALEADDDSAGANAAPPARRRAELRLATPRGPVTLLAEVDATAAETGARVAALVERVAAEAVAARGRFTLAVCGGSVADVLGAGLRAAPPRDVSQWRILFADERLVALNDKDSNKLTCERAFLAHLPFKREQVVTIDEALIAQPDAAAADYERRVLAACGVAEAKEGAAPPAIDLVVLGVGPDGHVASLFPGHALLREERRLVAALTDSPKPPSARVTMTLPLLNAARAVALVVTGGSKADVLRQLVKTDAPLPAKLAHDSSRRICLFADASAAALAL